MSVPPLFGVSPANAADANTDIAAVAACHLYTSDAADDSLRVDAGGVSLLEN